jgi:hypothetical protein
MNKNRIQGVADQGERAINREAPNAGRMEATSGEAVRNSISDEANRVHLHKASKTVAVKAWFDRLGLVRLS